MQDISDWLVLIVDDEPDNVGVVELVFEFHNAVVHSAGSGVQCLRLLEDGLLPNVMLIDIQMPVMSGYDLLARIREQERFQDMPIVAVTAHARQEDENQIRTAGFDGYIAKPINVMTIVEDVFAIVQEKSTN